MVITSIMLVIIIILIILLKNIYDRYERNIQLSPLGGIYFLAELLI